MRARFVKKVHQQHLDTLGADLGPVFTALYEDVIGLHIKLAEYRTLFTTNSARVDILNEAAGSFFVMANQVLWDDIILSIARLVDPAKSHSKHENLTLAVLPTLLNDDALRERVATAVAEAQASAKFAESHRHKRLAHTDRAQRLDPDRVPPEGSIHQAVVAAKAFGQVLNVINGHFGGGEIMFDSPLLGGADALLRVLRAGNEARRRQLTRWEGGDLTEADLKGEADI